MLVSKSNILYIRAGLKPLAKQIKLDGGLINFLQKYIKFNEIFCPNFTFSRPFWRNQEKHLNSKKSKIGGLARLLCLEKNVEISNHPSHSFIGLGDRVIKILKNHNSNTSCFYPIDILAQQYDFSMLLIGCLENSPGFSTVHVAQNYIGITRKRLIKYLYRWDEIINDKVISYTAPEIPGCSRQFGNFYNFYKADNNFITGTWFNVDWIFIPSAFRAIKTEFNLLNKNNNFANCSKLNCLSCRLSYFDNIIN